MVAAGEGGGTFDGTTLRVGSGNGVALRLALEFVLLFALAFSLAAGLTSAIGVWISSAFAFGEALTFAAGFVAPPDGSPSSALPVGGCAGWTGWLFGSAASDWFVWFAFGTVLLAGEILVHA